MNFKYMGHSTLLVSTYDSMRIIIDPFLKSNPFLNEDMWKDLEVDIICLTHVHFDHSENVDDLLSKNKLAKLICTPEVARKFVNKHGNQIIKVGIGATYKIKNTTFKLVPALTGNAEYDTDYGPACGFVINDSRIKMYHAGDTALIADMGLLAYENIDVSFLPAGSRYTMDMVDAARAANIIKTKLYVPIHYNTFDDIKVDKDEIVKVANSLKAPCKIIPPLGEFSI